MGELGYVSTDLDACIAIQITVLDAGKMILGMQVQASLAITLKKGNRLHPLNSVDLLRNNLPSTTVDYQCTVFTNESQAMIAAISTVVDTDGMIPHYSEVIEGIDGLKQVRGLACIIRITEFAT